MKPLLSRFEQQNRSDSENPTLNPVEESTTIDRIYTSTLLQSDNILHASTKVTKVRAETTDDD